MLHESVCICLYIYILYMYIFIHIYIYTYIHSTWSARAAMRLVLCVALLTAEAAKGRIQVSSKV